MPYEDSRFLCNLSYLFCEYACQGSRRCIRKHDMLPKACAIKGLHKLMLLREVLQGLQNNILLVLQWVQKLPVIGLWLKPGDILRKRSSQLCAVVIDGGAQVYC